MKALKLKMSHSENIQKISELLGSSVQSAKTLRKKSRLSKNYLQWLLANNFSRAHPLETGSLKWSPQNPTRRNLKGTPNLWKTAQA